MSTNKHYHSGGYPAKSSRQTRSTVMVVKAFLTVVVLFLCGCETAQQFLADVESEDIRIVRHRLEEEKEKRLLLQNDVEILMLKVAKLERALTSAVQGM